MTKFEIALVPCLSDNYGVLVHAPATGETLSIDAPEAGALKTALAARNWRLTHIFVTHHHTDHTQGILALKDAYGCAVTGPAGEADRIPGIDHSVSEKSPLGFAGRNARVLETPGHTLGHIVYHFPDEALVFTGDALFALGCGRIFEGDAEGMWRGIEKIMSLPPETSIYCGHEYTLANARFAKTVEPENALLVERTERIEALRAANKPTLPATLGEELATNPFLRPSSPQIRARLGMQEQPDWRVFQRLRELKNKS